MWLVPSCSSMPSWIIGKIDKSMTIENFIQYTKRMTCVCIFLHFIIPALLISTSHFPSWRHGYILIFEKFENIQSTECHDLFIELCNKVSNWLKTWKVTLPENEKCVLCWSISGRPAVNIFVSCIQDNFLSLLFTLTQVPTTLIMHCHIKGPYYVNIA